MNPQPVMFSLTLCANTPRLPSNINNISTLTISNASIRSVLLSTGQKFSHGYEVLIVSGSFMKSGEHNNDKGEQKIRTIKSTKKLSEG